MTLIDPLMYAVCVLLYAILGVVIPADGQYEGSGIYQDQTNSKLVAIAVTFEIKDGKIKQMTASNDGSELQLIPSGTDLSIDFAKRGSSIKTKNGDEVTIKEAHIKSQISMKELPGVTFEKDAVKNIAVGRTSDGMDIIHGENFVSVMDAKTKNALVTFMYIPKKKDDHK